MKNSILIICLLLSIAACDFQKKEDNTEQSNPETKNTVILTTEQLKNAAVTTGELKKQDISSVLKATGQINVPPQNMVSVSMPLGGYLKSTKLLPGLRFTKGDVIAVMEDQQYIQLQQDYLITKSKLNFAEKEYARQKELNQNKASSDKVFQLAEAEYKTLQITLSSLAEKLKLINVNPSRLTENTLSKSIPIYAPINGYVSKVNVNIGKYVNPSDVLFELINPTDILLKLQIFEKDIHKLFIGQKLYSYTNNNPEVKYQNTIVLISQDANDERVFNIHCRFEKLNPNLLPGMYMNAAIELKNNAVFALPQDAVVTFEGAEYVFIALTKDKFKMTPVKTGVQENGFIEITNGTDFKTRQIVLTGAYSLLMQLKNEME